MQIAIVQSEKMKRVLCIVNIKKKKFKTVLKRRRITICQSLVQFFYTVHVLVQCLKLHFSLQDHIRGKHGLSRSLHMDSLVHLVGNEEVP